jgi:hypothetical protein
MEVCLRNPLSAIEHGPRVDGHHDDMTRRPRRVGSVKHGIGRSSGKPSLAPWNLG